jgi:hypothetical protein
MANESPPEMSHLPNVPLRAHGPARGKQGNPAANARSGRELPSPCVAQRLPTRLQETLTHMTTDDKAAALGGVGPRHARRPEAADGWLSGAPCVGQS